MLEHHFVTFTPQTALPEVYQVMHLKYYRV